MARFGETDGPQLELRSPDSLTQKVFGINNSGALVTDGTNNIIDSIDNLSGVNTGDEVAEYTDFASFPGTGETGLIYIAQDTGLLYRWNGSSYDSIGGGGDWNDLTGTVDTIPFNISLTKPAYSEGLFYYDEDEHAFVGYNDEMDVTQQIGREFFRRVRNESGSTILNGKVVYQSGAETGGEGRALIDLAKADSETTENVIGIATHDIENNSYGYVTVLGDVNDVDTSLFTAGSVLYLSPDTAGELTITRPNADQFVVEVATSEIINATTGRFNVNITNSGRLTDFDFVGDTGSSWLIGLEVTENDPDNQTVDYSNGQYYIRGSLYNLSSSGNYDFENGHAAQNEYSGMTNYQHRFTAMYVDTDESMKSVAGPIAEKYETPDFPTLPVDVVCIAIVELRVDSGGTPKDIKNENITDCRSQIGNVIVDELVKVSPDDTQSSYLEDALTNNGNVTFTKENTGANEALKADVDLSGKVDTNAPITGDTKTKITYDSKGLVTTGVDATTADINPSTDRNYVTDTESTVIGNTSGTNTGDQIINLTGDVTGSGTGSFTTTISNDSVTFNKIQNAVSNDKLLGSGNSGAANDYTEITLGTNLSMDGTTLNATASNLSPIITPPTITENTNDYNPTGLSTVKLLRLSTSSNRDLTGIVAQLGRDIYIVNVGSNQIKIKKENTGSLANNRFSIPTDLTLDAGNCAHIWYDDVDSRWRIISTQII